MESDPDVNATAESAARVTRNAMSGSGPASAGPSSKTRQVKLDHTLLKPPMVTSVTGMKQAVLALENSTPEVSN